MSARAPTPVGRPRCVIAIGASAGGVDALRALVRDLPAGLPAAICIVLHISPTSGGLLAPILDRVSDLRAQLAEHGMPLREGNVYVAPADRHLLIGERDLELTAGPRENSVRPAVDPMFRSLARTHGRRAVAVVLSGALDDGSAGAVTVAAAGGTVVVQDPADAMVPGMPESAVNADSPRHVIRWRRWRPCSHALRRSPGMTMITRGTDRWLRTTIRRTRRSRTGRAGHRRR